MRMQVRPGRRMCRVQLRLHFATVRAIRRYTDTLHNATRLCSLRGIRQTVLAYVNVKNMPRAGV